MHGEWSEPFGLYGGGSESIVRSGRMRTCRGEEGGLVESATTMTVEPWREGGQQCTSSGEIGKEDERRGMRGKRVTLMRGDGGSKLGLEQGNEGGEQAMNGLAGQQRPARPKMVKREQRFPLFVQILADSDSHSWTRCQTL